MLLGVGDRMFVVKRERERESERERVSERERERNCVWWKERFNLGAEKRGKTHC